MLTGILKVSGLPGQSTFWRFLASLNLNLAGQLSQLQRILRERVWAAAHVGLKSITLDTDTTVHTLYGRQMGARKSYNPKNKGKKSYQPMLTFIAETHEYVWGELRNGDRPDGKQIARHLQNVAALPYASRTSSRGPIPDSIVGKPWMPTKKPTWIHDRGAEDLPSAGATGTADWKPSPKTDADEQCEFVYQPEGWGKAYRFVALRYENTEEKNPKSEQYQLFETPHYKYRVFVTNLEGAIDLLVWFYNQRAGSREPD